VAPVLEDLNRKDKIKLQQLPDGNVLSRNSLEAFLEMVNFVLKTVTLLNEASLLTLVYISQHLQILFNNHNLIKLHGTPVTRMLLINL